MVPPAFQSSPVAPALPEKLAAPTPAQADAHSDDMRLLRRYVDHGSQAAFSQLTAKHLSWVYAMCRRTLRDKHLAEDASQAVFVLLARRASSLSAQTRVAGWLFNTTRFVLRDVRKSEGRFQRRQGVARELARDRMLDFDDGEQDRIDPRLQTALDEGLALLGERDRQALMTHFYEGLTLAQMADRLGISRDGVKKRVGRALARLRTLLGKGKGEIGKAGAKGKKGGLSLLALAMLLRGRDAGAAIPSGLFNATVAASTIPGAAPFIIEQILSGVAITLNVASKRLLHALLAGQGVLILLVIAAVSRPSAPARVAISPPFPAAPAITQSWIESHTPAAGGVLIADLKTPVTSAGQPEVAEPPYRSGADDPDPNQKRPSPEKPAPQPARLADAGEGVIAGPALGRENSYAGGTTYAGVAPVARTAFPTQTFAVYEPRPYYPTAATPFAGSAGRSSSTGGGAAPERAAKTEAAAVTARSSSAESSAQPARECRYPVPPIFAITPTDRAMPSPDHRLIPEHGLNDKANAQAAGGGTVHPVRFPLPSDGLHGNELATKDGNPHRLHTAHPAATRRPCVVENADFLATPPGFDPLNVDSFPTHGPNAEALVNAALDPDERPAQLHHHGVPGSAHLIGFKGERSTASSHRPSSGSQPMSPPGQSWNFGEQRMEDPGAWNPGDQLALADSSFTASEASALQAAATPTPEPTAAIGLITAALLYLPRRARRK